MRKIFFCFAVLFAFIMGSQNQAFSRDSYRGDSLFVGDDIINRPVNIQGLTGLLFTNSAYTQPAGSVTFGVSGLAEDSSNPNYSVAQGTASMTVGLSDSVEAGVRGKMFGWSFGSSTDRDTGLGDTDLLLKWRFSSQGNFFPALAFGLAWTLPTGDSEKGLTEVKYEGIRLMVMATGENTVLDDSFIGIYMEAQAVFNDQLHADDKSPYKEKYGVVNAGILFPLSDDNNLQFLLEYTRVVKRNYMMLYDRNYSGLVPGLRFVTKNFNLTVGVQQIDREDSGPAADSKGHRIAGTLSYRF